MLTINDFMQILPSMEYIELPRENNIALLKLAWIAFTGDMKKGLFYA